MSNLLLLLHAAFAQEGPCIPEADEIIAVPGPGAWDVPIDIVPVFVVDRPGCDAALVVELVSTANDSDIVIASDRGFEGFYSTSWSLSPNTDYEVFVYLADTGELIDDWEFTTGERYAAPMNDPTTITVVDGLFFLEEDGAYTQDVTIDFVVPTLEDRVLVLTNEDGRQLRATTTSLLAESGMREWADWRVGTVTNEVCVWMTEFDHFGVAYTDRFCGPNDNGDLLSDDVGCRTASVRRWSFGWSWFSRR